jgi:hypothetical protein
MKKKAPVAGRVTHLLQTKTEMENSLRQKQLSLYLRYKVPTDFAQVLLFVLVRYHLTDDSCRPSYQSVFQPTATSCFPKPTETQRLRDRWVISPRDASRERDWVDTSHDGRLPER